MLLELDKELADLVTDLKWCDWTATYTIAVVLNAESAVISAAAVIEEDAELVYRLEGVRTDHWSVNDLFMDLLCSVAYGMSMTRPNGSYRYVVAMLAAIRRYELDHDA